jgi:type II secretory pathway pseudopilin PulG
VTVIVILGILAVVVVWQFLDPGKEARTATLASVAGTLRSAHARVYARAEEAGKLDKADTITIDGATIKLKNGYPATMDDLLLVANIELGEDLERRNAAIFFKNKIDKITGGSMCFVSYSSGAFSMNTMGC